MMFNPAELRALTNKANLGFESQKAAATEKRIQRTVTDAIARADAASVDAANEGKHEAIVFEIESDTTVFNDLSYETIEAFNRVKAHFEEQGFKTRIHGPFTGGGPSHVFCGGWDLYIIW